MKKKSLLITLLLIVILIIFKVFFSEKKMHQDSNISANIKTQAKTKVIYPIKQSNTKKEFSNKKEFTEEDIIETRDFVNNMKEEYTKLQFDTIFKDKLQKMYNQNNNIAQIFKNIILDNNFAKVISIENQAYARVFAINGLKEIALINNIEPLLNTIQEYSLILQNKEIFSKGEKADLDDLISNYISTIDTSSFIENIEHHLTEINFNNEIKNNEIIKIYKNSVFFSLMEKVGEEKARKLLEQHFSK
ncbi:hypothetical protein [Fluviispira multicolorata]|uniref:Uncharacterized protein n=1 Tax=Fluviispira multicolorata TaxID=2654512 RepID=A0A833JB79_9BACT|nr:hypothetical protein [Fluviispira multicolorata]KAB8028083.1 hypothetical protein GCL57_13610 [Fluviispira multicolorata]